MTWPWRRGKPRQEDRVGCVLSEGLPMRCRLGEEVESSEGARTGGQVRAQSLGAAGGPRVGSGEGV